MDRESTSEFCVRYTSIPAIPAPNEEKRHLLRENQPDKTPRLEIPHGNTPVLTPRIDGPVARDEGQHAALVDRERLQEGRTRGRAVPDLSMRHVQRFQKHS
jgi:hypothetical protein